jgi:plasmid stabilization system protein ParE
MLPIVWSSKALDDLDGIVAFVAPRDFGAAVRLHDRIEQSVLPTASHPYMFRSGRVDGTREDRRASQLRCGLSRAVRDDPGERPSFTRAKNTPDRCGPATRTIHNQV